MAKKKTSTTTRSGRKSTASRTSPPRSAKKASTGKKASRSTSSRRKVTKKAAAGKKVTKKTTARKKPVAKKKVTRKTTAKKTTAKKTTARKTTAKKKTTSKKVAKKTTAKKKPAKKAVTAKKATSKKKVTKKTSSTKKTATKKTSSKAAQKSKSKKASEVGTSRRKRRQTVVEAVVVGEADDRGFVVVNGRRIRRISTESVKKTRKRSVTAARTGTVKKDDKDKRIKSKLPKAEIRHFRDLLITKRKQLLTAVDSMEFEALRSDDGDTSSMPIHMADVGSDVYEQDLMLGMAASERQRIRDIDEALARIADGTYGICALTKKPISKKRLTAKPWAKYSIDAARKIERGL